MSVCPKSGFYVPIFIIFEIKMYDGMRYVQQKWWENDKNIYLGISTAASV